MLSRRIDDEAVEGDDADLRARRGGNRLRLRLQHGRALLRREHGLLGVVGADADDELVEQAAGARDHIGMAESDGVERAGIKADTFHGLSFGGLRLQNRLVLSRAYGRVQLLTASP